MNLPNFKRIFYDYGIPVLVSDLITRFRSKIFVFCDTIPKKKSVKPVFVFILLIYNLNIVTGLCSGISAEIGM